MQYTFPYKRSLLCTAISLSLLPISTASFAQDTVEEVLVTGSFIRRSEGFTQASAVTQLTADDLMAQGTMNMGEVIQNLAFVNGAASSTTNSIQGTNSRESNIDLRGLGASSTLTLLDGKRVANENVNAMIPQIAIQRLDIVADGAAALYGSEAVAGVVNFVPYKSYDGFKLEAYTEQDSRGDYDEHNAQFLWGTTLFEEVDVVMAGSFRDAGRLEWAERPLLAQSGTTISAFSNPGTWSVPQRDANGQYTGRNAGRPDPNCGEGRDAIQPGVAASPAGIRDGNICRFEFGDTRDYREASQTTSLYTNFNWETSEDLTLSSQFFYSRLANNAPSSTSNPGGSRVPELPVVRGEIPGNSFRAVNSAGMPLFGMDGNGDGIPDRGAQDLNGDGLPDYLLSANPTDPLSGVPVYEDVVASRIRPIGKANTLPNGFSADGENWSDSKDTNFRASFQADFTVPFIDGWEGMAAFTHSWAEFDLMSNQNFDITAMIQGLNCDVVNDRDACYSPFAIVNPADLTSIAVMDDIAARDREQEEDILQVIDLIFNGEVSPGGFELPGGAIGMAVGYQRRMDEFTNTPSAVEIAGDAFIGTPENEIVFGARRSVDAFFAEVSLPVLDNLEVSLAVRNESFSTGQSSTDPKIGVTWAPTDWLLLRGTTGDAFIAPSLNQLNAPEACGLSNADDPFGPFSGFVTACQAGNPNLQNESSRTTSFGFDLNPMDNLTLSATYNQTEFVNRIVTQTAAQILANDFFQFRQVTGAGPERPTLAQLQAWNNNPARDVRITRAAADITEIAEIRTGASNAESVEVEALDINATYTYDAGNIGNFRVNLQATQIASFMYQQDATSPLIEAVGKQNFLAGGTAPALPEWKANLSMNWSRGDHAATAIVRYVGEMDYDGPQNSFLDRFENTFRPQNLQTINAWTDMDVVYNYRGLKLFEGQTNISIGARNLFDREAQRTPMLAGIVAELQDALGRVVYLRANYEF
jgi:outer membrane receptor for ferrienterochelin and colicin